MKDYLYFWGIGSAGWGGEQSRLLDAGNASLNLGAGYRDLFVLSKFIELNI